ncbi:ATP-binding protein [Aureimonas mangrovi]|uniref:ATP-binding protein n=1 Tax=Aureimonas mangrovi TaxID=2758041 RepID=UPI00163D8810|nr:ATP-binding protein [Aureimonas mangrovi]
MRDMLAELVATVRRVAAALERSAPPAPELPDLDLADCFVFEPPATLRPVPQVARVPLDILAGIERSKATLLENTRRFAAGLPANNALLWGARGMGKSSLVKAVHAEVNTDHTPLKLIEIHREDIEHLPGLMVHLRDADVPVLLFCDDLSFDGDDASYKSLKAALEGGVEGRPSNVLFYATSNRRHLLPRSMMENEQATAITPGEAVEEKVSLSDRFGLWLGFHACSQDDYLTMVSRYLDAYAIEAEDEEVRRAALEWATTRGSRSGRVAFQFVTDFAASKGMRLG